MPGHNTVPAIIRLIEKTEIDMVTGCWIANGYNTRDGHGRIYYQAIEMYTSRFSAIFFLGLDIKNKKEQANHKLICPNKKCWNPAHIYIGSQSQNVRDSIKLGTHSSLYNKPPIRKKQVK